jgi:hypothetical protein
MDIKNNEELSSNKKEIDSLISKTNVKEVNETSAHKNDIKAIDKEYYERGRDGAKKMNGYPEGLKSNLHMIYQEYKTFIQNNDDYQKKLKEKFHYQIENIKLEIEKKEKEIETIENGSITPLKTKINTIKDDIIDILKNPDSIQGNKEVRVKFYISGIILCFLTIFLFIFYSSASYSAFFKQFSINNIGVVSSIFDSKAVVNAISESFSEFLFIMTIPFAFIALGFLIHMFIQRKNNLKFSVILLITFIFDIIIAYDISQKIYDIQKSISYGGDKIPNYNFSLAITNISFWLIIFSGFVIYIIWGLLFNFFIELLNKLDKVKIAVNENEKKILDLQSEINIFETRKLTLENEIYEEKKKLNNSEAILSDSIIIPNDHIKVLLNEYYLGWTTWMINDEIPDEKLKESSDIWYSFIKDKYPIIDKMVNPFKEVISNN